MKTIIAIAIASIIAITALAFMADTIETVETKETIGITVQGKVGVKLGENVCLDPTNGQVKVCF